MRFFQTKRFETRIPCDLRMLNSAAASTSLHQGGPRWEEHSLFAQPSHLRLRLYCKHLRCINCTWIKQHCHSWWPWLNILPKCWLMLDSMIINLCLCPPTPILSYFFLNSGSAARMCQRYKWKIRWVPNPKTNMERMGGMFCELQNLRRIFSHWLIDSFVKEDFTHHIFGAVRINTMAQLPIRVLWNT